MRGMNEVKYYLQIISVTGVYLLYYFAMIYVTVNRMLETLFHVKYPSYITKKKVMYLLGGTCLICVVICISCSVIDFADYPILKLHMFASYSRYIYPGLDVTFIVIVAVYGCLNVAKFKARLIFQ